MFFFHIIQTKFWFKKNFAKNNTLWCSRILVYVCLDPHHDMVSQDPCLVGNKKRAWWSGVATSTKVLTTRVRPPTSSTSARQTIARAVHQRLVFSLQVYHQVFYSRELLFLFNLKTLWVISTSTPSLELFPRKAKQDI